MPKPKLRLSQEAAKILGVSYNTVKEWIYKGKLRTVKTLGGHHRILEEDIKKRLRSKLAEVNPRKLGLGPDKISESNQLQGRPLEIRVDGLMAQVRMMAGGHELTTLIPANAAKALRLKPGDNLVALLKSSQIMILREPV